MQSLSRGGSVAEGVNPGADRGGAEEQRL